jgi:16S rRNA (cytosine967-C5)-methyltransferase
LWPLLAPGGLLLYATCSVFKAEGSAQIEAFVAHNKQAQSLASPGHLWPQSLTAGGSFPDNGLGAHDGFFYALLQKRSEPATRPL